MVDNLPMVVELSRQDEKVFIVVIPPKATDIEEGPLQDRCFRLNARSIEKNNSNLFSKDCGDHFRDRFHF